MSTPTSMDVGTRELHPKNPDGLAESVVEMSIHILDACRIGLGGGFSSPRTDMRVTFDLCAYPSARLNRNLSLDFGFNKKKLKL